MTRPSDIDTVIDRMMARADRQALMALGLLSLLMLVACWIVEAMR